MFLYARSADSRQLQSGILEDPPLSAEARAGLAPEEEEEGAGPTFFSQTT
jgi:hypothetical protein